MEKEGKASDLNYDVNDFEHLTPQYNWEIQRVNLHDYKNIIEKIDPNTPIINLCDGNEINGIPGLSCVKFLEEKNLWYTGCSPRNYSWPKAEIKKYPVNTPRYFVIHKS